mmetsp:Transcript_39981/g.105671  ORF Transcript_39981/g.105671 Transcript_39981/m.105671 type:complete len:223 (-) Transcript_39981:434-1102(-)
MPRRELHLAGPAYSIHSMSGSCASTLRACTLLISSQLLPRSRIGSKSAPSLPMRPSQSSRSSQTDSVHTESAPSSSSSPAATLAALRAALFSTFSAVRAAAPASHSFTIISISAIRSLLPFGPVGVTFPRFSFDSRSFAMSTTLNLSLPPMDVQLPPPSMRASTTFDHPETTAQCNAVMRQRLSRCLTLAPASSSVRTVCTLPNPPAKVAASRRGLSSPASM